MDRRIALATLGGNQRYSITNYASLCLFYHRRKGEVKCFRMNVISAVHYGYFSHPRQGTQAQRSTDA
ncbi:MAG: hypothetical protein NC123_17065, partial [Butyrivibrio sp.]|nr:hypothetical protein [Butyrivibrio sp.]